MSVLGIPLFAQDIDGAVALVSQSCLEGTVFAPRCISATGAQGLVTAQRDPGFRRLVEGFYINPEEIIRRVREGDAELAAGAAAAEVSKKLGVKEAMFHRLGN